MFGILAFRIVFSPYNKATFPLHAVKSLRQNISLSHHTGPTKEYGRACYIGAKNY